MPPPSTVYESSGANDSVSVSSGGATISNNSTTTNNNTTTHTNEINSVRELNNLLEFALRSMGVGDDDECWCCNKDETQSSAVAPSSAPDQSSHGDGSNIGINNTCHLKSRSSGCGSGHSEVVEYAASWRLDTARRLSSLLASQNLNDFQQEGEVNLLLPSLQRQSRYWIPLLLNWLKGGIGDNESTTDHETIATITASANKHVNELPLKAKQRRQQRQKSAQLSSSIISAEVQIEALRVLTALTEWKSRVGEGGMPLTTTTMNEEEEDALDRVHKKYTTSQLLTAGCTPQNPLSPSSQRLLLRQRDAVPTIVSLLSSPDAAIHEQAMWILGSIASSGLGATALPTPPPQAAAARAAAAEVTKMMSDHSSGGSTSSGLDGSMSVAISTAAVSSSSEMVDGVGKDALVDNISPVPHRISSSSKDKSSISARDVIFAAGAMDSILKCLADNPRNVPLHRVGAWCLSNLVEGRYSNSSSTNEKDTSSSTSTRKPVAIDRDGHIYPFTDGEANVAHG